MQEEIEQYVNEVTSGRIIACEAVKKACQRHLNDLSREKENSFPFLFDVEKADKVIRFIEFLPDVKTGERYTLMPFQKFIIGMLYGWREKRNVNNRRFKKAFISMARKNGKSILISGIALYEFLFGKNPKLGRQIFCTANDKKQASIVFDMVRKQLDALCAKDQDIRNGTKHVRGVLKNLYDESYVMALSRETGTVDGFEPYVGILDEYAASKSTDMMELLESGQGQLKNALICIISTAGFNLNAPMYQIEYPYVKAVLEGKDTIDEEYFAFIAEQDNVEEVNTPSSWIKSNPILAVENLHEHFFHYLEKRKKEALQKGTLNAILVKNFNMWRQADEDSYMSAEEWETSLVEEPEDVTGRRVWIGIDVGKTSDLFSISWLTMKEEKKHWFIGSHSFVATKYGLDNKIKRDGIDYRHLAAIGECHITSLESGVIDNEEVFSWLEDFVIHHQLIVEGICYDPYQFGDLLTRIEKTHPEWPLIEVVQGTRTLSMPTKQFKDDVLSGKIKHTRNQLLDSAVYNAILLADNNGVRINKAKNSNKIDPIDALLDAYAVCFLEEFDTALDDKFILSDEFGF